MSEDRKYRHRGYMESNEERPRTPRDRDDSGPGSSPGAPRGRSAGIDKQLAISCKKCGHKISVLEEIGTGDVCPKCGGDLHACVQCKHFDTSSRWECSRNREIPGRIAAKDRRNDCAVFSPALSFDMTGSKSPAIGDARQAFDNLFKK